MWGWVSKTLQTKLIGGINVQDVLIGAAAVGATVATGGLGGIAAAAIGAGVGGVGSGVLTGLETGSVSSGVTAGLLGAAAGIGGGVAGRGVEALLVRGVGSRIGQRLITTAATRTALTNAARTSLVGDTHLSTALGVGGGAGLAASASPQSKTYTSLPTRILKPTAAT